MRRGVCSWWGQVGMGQGKVTCWVLLAGVWGTWVMFREGSGPEVWSLEERLRI